MADVTTSDPAAPPDDGEPPALVTSLHGCPTSDSLGQTVVHPSREQYLDLLRHLLDDGYDQCLDVFGVDYLTHPGRTLPAGVDAERFEVVLLLINHRERTRLRVRVQVPEDGPGRCPRRSSCGRARRRSSERPTTCSASSSPGIPT